MKSKRAAEDGYSITAGLKPKELKEAFNSWFLVLALISVTSFTESASGFLLVQYG